MPLRPFVMLFREKLPFCVFANNSMVIFITCECGKIDILFVLLTPYNIKDVYASHGYVICREAVMGNYILPGGIIFIDVTTVT